MRVVLLTVSSLTGPINQRDGFAQRYETLVTLLDQQTELLVVESTPAGAGTPPAQERPRVHQTSRPNDIVDLSRKGRLHLTAKRLFPRLLGPPRSEPWQLAALDAVEAWKPDAVVAIAHSGMDLWAEVCGAFPTVVFAEEKMATPDVSRKGRAFDRLEEWAQRHTEPAPAAVVVISAQETKWAKELYPHSPVLVLEHVVDVDYWACVPPPRPTSIDVLFVGRLDHPRNSDGLLAIARATSALRPSSPLTFTAAGVAPPQPVIAALTEAGVEYVGAPEDVRPLYGRASIALVPPFVGGEAKTTILQAWAMSVPVVTTATAAASLCVSHGGEVLAADTPAAVARALIELRSQPGLMAELVERGTQRLYRHHSRTAFDKQLHAALDLARRGPKPAP